MLSVLFLGTRATDIFQMIVVLLSSSASLKHVMNFGCFPESPEFNTLHCKKSAGGGSTDSNPGELGGGCQKLKVICLREQIQGQPGTLGILSQITKKQGGAPL